MNRSKPLDTKLMKATDTILENLLDAVLVVDHNGFIIYANRSAQRLFQKHADELLHQSFGFPILPYEEQEIQLLKNGALLTVQMLASHIQWEGRKASLLSLRDITAQKRTTEELEEQRKLLEQSNEENAQFASLASHDLKEPVRKIILFSDRLLGTVRLEPKEKEMLAKIQASARKMQALINGIAELSKVTHVQHVFEPVDLKKVVEEVCEDLEIQIAEKEASVIAGPLPTIEAVPDKVYQLFLNLISNSLKYGRENVKPVIRIYSEPWNEGWVKIVSTDNGIGFDNAFAAQLFQPFRRLHHKQYDGVGIGLSLCHKIVELHGGQIRADGREGEGATFTLYLPENQCNAGLPN